MVSSNSDVRLHKRLAEGQKVDPKFKDGGKVSEDKDVEAAEKRDPKSRKVAEEAEKGLNNKTDDYKKGGKVKAKKAIEIAIRPVKVAEKEAPMPMMADDEMPMMRKSGGRASTKIKDCGSDSY